MTSHLASGRIGLRRGALAAATLLALTVLALWAGVPSAGAEQYGAPTQVGPNVPNPDGVAVNAAGDVFVAAITANQIIEIFPDGSSSVYASVNEPLGIALDSSGDLYVVNGNANKVIKIKPDGTQVQVGTGWQYPQSVGVDAAGDVFVVDLGPQDLVEVKPDGTQKILASGFDYPEALAVDAAGDAFVDDTFHNQVVEVKPDGTQLTLASDLSNSLGVAVDGVGDVIISDFRNNRIQEVTPDGTESTIASGVYSPEGITTDAAGDVYFENQGGNLQMLPLTSPAQVAVSVTKQSDGTFTVTATAENAAGATETSWEDSSPSYSDADGLLGSQPLSPFVDGVSTTTGITLTPTDPEPDTITFTTGGLSGTSASFTVAPKNPNSVAASADLQPDGTYTVTGVALDADGTTDTAYQDPSPTWYDEDNALQTPNPAPFVNGVSTTTGVVLEGDPTSTDVVLLVTDRITAFSNYVTVVAPPANTYPPVVSGTLQDGAKLTALTGTWSSASALSHAYQWFSCTSDDAGSCSQITGAMHSTYVPPAAQIGRYIAVRVTVTDKLGGKASQMSAVRGPVSPPAPVETSQPSVTGTAQDGQTLTAHRPNWSDPVKMAYTYAWYACSDQTASSCQVIAGKTSYTLKVTSAQVGEYVEGVMTATAGDASSSDDAFTASVVANPAAPVNTTAPKISGSTNTGAKATVTTGKWTSPDTLTYTYQWYRCTMATDPSTCKSISGAHSNDHVRVAADAGDTLAVKVTATDAEGQATSDTVLQS